MRTRLPAGWILNKSFINQAGSRFNSRGDRYVDIEFRGPES
jgi:hypothetical protein